MMRAGRRVQRTEPRCLPVLLVVSAQKSGTTALMGYLLFHPGFAAPQRKEAHFFDRAFAASSRPASRASEAGPLDQTPRPKMLARYLSGFARPASRGVAADATPSCMLSRQAMLRAQALLPAARIVVLLRDPVDRAWSEYNMKLRRIDAQMHLDDLNTQSIALEVYRTCHQDSL